MNFSLLKRWWCDRARASFAVRKLQKALQQGKYARANYYLKQLEDLKIELPLIASIYKQKLKADNTANYYQQETIKLTKQLQSVSSSGYYLQPDLDFISFINKNFKIKEWLPRDRFMLQVTGIYESVFNNLEIALTDFIETEINKVKPDKQAIELQKALDDLLGLKKGIDPSYEYHFSPHIYFLKYFAENIYTNYLAWFLVYQSGLLPHNLKILDIAAGSGTVIYGLALLIESMRNFLTCSSMEVSYYSLEQQAALQYRGLQFWRSYMESWDNPLNAYFRFNTLDIFDYQNYKSKLPQEFFNFIVISHCFFYDKKLKADSHRIYRQIFQKNLQTDGYVLLIVQGKKLFNLYDAIPSGDILEEEQIMSMFLDDLGLDLQWYRYLTSTGSRTNLKTNFAEFATENLPPQQYLAPARQKYLKENFIAHYAIDDYVILAKKSQKN